MHVQDVQASTSVHQHLGEPRVADDGTNNQRVLARVGDVVQVILTTEGGGVLRPVEEGRRGLLRSEDLVPLPLVLAVGHVHSPPSRR
jgi:hypothetical protein